MPTGTEEPMKRRAPLFTAIAVWSVLAFCTDVDASHMDGSQWACSSAERIKITSLPVSTDAHSGITITFNAGNFTLTHPDWGTFNGTVEDRGSSGRFRAYPDAPSVEAFKEYLADVAQTSLGADSITVTSIVVKIAGKGDPAADTLTVKAKTLMKGSAVLGSRVRRGKVKAKATLLGNQSN